MRVNQQVDLYVLLELNHVKSFKAICNFLIFQSYTSHHHCFTNN